MAVSKQCKSVLCFFYVGLLFVSGILLFGSCIYLTYKLFSYTHNFKFAPAECVAPFILLIILACGHCGISRFGYNGATKDHLNHIVWFKLGLVVHIICEIGIGIWAILLNKKVVLSSTVLMTESFKSYLSNSYDKSSWESLQRELQCCGINNPSDYTILNPSSGSILIACCETDTCTHVFQRGCKEYVIENVKKLLLDIIFISFGSAVFMILGIVCFCYLHKSIKEQSKTEANGRTASRTTV